MKNILFLLIPLILLISCSEDREIKVSSPYSEPIKVEITGDPDFEPIHVTQTGGGIDLSYKTTFTAPAKQEFKVIMSNGKLDKFIGLDFKAEFHHYAKLLSVEYKSLDSITIIKYYNNPISWTADANNN